MALYRLRQLPSAQLLDKRSHCTVVSDLRKEILRFIYSEEKRFFTARYTYPPTVLTSSGGQQNMYGWREGGTHPTVMLSSFFDFCHCSLWTLNCILFKSIWKRWLCRFLTNINEPLNWRHIPLHNHGYTICEVLVRSPWTGGGWSCRGSRGSSKNTRRSSRTAEGS